MTASPLLCAPERKAELEARNALAQLEYLEYVVGRGQRAIRLSDVLQLQQLAVEGIYPCGGHFRDARFSVELPDSAHRPPPASMVEPHVLELLDAINSKTSFVTTRAAFALWRLNWIHAFPGGNGRTARAIAYLVLCIDMQMMLPGLPTMPALIAQQRDAYIDALRDVDHRALKTDGSVGALMNPDVLGPMDDYFTNIAVRQLLSAISANRKLPMKPFVTIFLRVATRAAEVWMRLKK